MYVDIWYQNNVVILIVWNKSFFTVTTLVRQVLLNANSHVNPLLPYWLPPKRLENLVWPCSMGWPGNSSGHWDLSRSLKSPSERALVILAKCIHAPFHPTILPPALTKPAHQWRWKEDRGQSSLVISLTYAPFLVHCLRDTLKYLHCLSHSEILLHAAKRIPNWSM